ncbi:hypothetical protein HS088_TW06G01071 [Tripterygium wilfordii]|uniref:U-box domain-containing protein n=1 Tax=Tripterygium wilfordii TaxID=458696 RepID=A0A7J7DKK6_TRIWF|nr:U-box domain-containing protein 7 [Tripterygium wilfordii]KAF5746895.1 hypothetical protein HS088_TW06G01071 [Tripterygium wilfordii]
MEDLVMENLFNGDKESQIRAATELGRLKSKQRQYLADRGVIVPLVSMLQSQDYEAIEAALFALLSLACGSERNKRRIVKSGVIPMLLQLLQSQNPLLIEHTLAAMLILSACSANKLVIASSGAVQVLIETLGGDYANDSNMNNISIQAKLDAIATLHNLSTCHQIVPLIVSSGVVFPLLHLIQGNEKSSEMVEKAIMLLENVISLSENALQETASTGGAIRALVEAIEDGSPQCKEHSAEILLLICQICRETYRGLILREGVMPGLLQLSVDGTWKAKEIAQNLLLLLRDGSSYCSRSNQSKHELIEQVMQEIDAQGDGTTLRLVEDMIAKLST